jgi:hypothetical protein
MVEHAADRGTIERPCLHAEADDLAGELIHHDQHLAGQCSGPGVPLGFFGSNSTEIQADDA